MTRLRLFTLVLFAHYVRVLYIHHGLQDGWTLGEWLISYTAGFTRRGLTGEIALTAGDVTGIPPWVMVFTIQTLCYGALLAAFLILVRGRERPFWFLMLVFSPAAFLFPAVDFSTAGRKEVILLAVLAWYVVALRSRRLSSHPGFLAASAFVAVTATLSHEWMFFYLPYFFAAAWLSRQAYGSSPASAACAAAGASAAMALILVAGSTVHGPALCADLVSRGFDPGMCVGNLGDNATLRDAVVRTLIFARDENYPVEYGASALLASIPFVLYFRQPAASQRVPLQRFLSFVAVAVAVSSPLFLTAEDWGRMLHVHVMALALLSTIVLADERPPVIGEPLPPAPDPRGSSGLRGSVLRVGAVATYASGWGMPHCCAGFVAPGVAQVVVARLARFVS